MAEIYRGKTFDRHGHAHLVAVKCVLPHLVEDREFIQMLVDEAKIASYLHHRNITRVYEFARANGEYFIAMEYIDGKDLRSIMAKLRQSKKPMPPEHAAYIVMQAAEGLHTAHNATDPTSGKLQIIHRDVSPSNILCSYTGHVKLCDFGIAKASLSQGHTHTGVIKGKIKYMSPEQALGRPLDSRTDIFSLGVCLYEMLCMVPPFMAENEMDLLLMVRDAKYERIAQCAPHVPHDIAMICEKALTKRRNQRIQTAADLARMARSFLEQYFPKYSRSHLARYLRNLFATEIDKELRLLEEYVVVQNQNSDLGENLIAAYDSQEQEFSPQPISGLHTPNLPTPDFDIHEADTLILPRTALRKKKQ